MPGRDRQKLYEALCAIQNGTTYFDEILNFEFPQACSQVPAKGAPSERALPLLQWAESQGQEVVERLWRAMAQRAPATLQVRENPVHPGASRATVVSNGSPSVCPTRNLRIIFAENGSPVTPLVECAAFAAEVSPELEASEISISIQPDHPQIHIYANAVSRMTLTENLPPEKRIALAELRRCLDEFHRLQEHLQIAVSMLFMDPEIKRSTALESPWPLGRVLYGLCILYGESVVFKPTCGIQFDLFHKSDRPSARMYLCTNDVDDLVRTFLGDKRGNSEHRIVLQGRHSIRDLTMDVYELRAVPAILWELARLRASQPELLHNSAMNLNEWFFGLG